MSRLEGSTSRIVYRPSGMLVVQTQPSIRGAAVTALVERLVILIDKPSPVSRSRRDADIGRPLRPTIAPLRANVGAEGVGVSVGSGVGVPSGASPGGIGGAGGGELSGGGVVGEGSGLGPLVGSGLAVVVGSGVAVGGTTQTSKLGTALANWIPATNTRAIFGLAAIVSEKKKASPEDGISRLPPIPEP